MKLSIRRRAAVAGATILLGTLGLAGPAFSAGANTSGAYDPSGVGLPSGNGVATTQPAAGTVGNADDKNPPGQAPDGSDGNNGYECDGNQGIGQTNPAHTGCAEVPPPPG
jgi:hypothetical protein